MNAFKLLTYSLAVLSASSAYAQHTVFATSGQGRGAATDARQQAQIDALTNRTQSIKSDGTVQLQDAGTCDPAAEGTMKYDSAAKTVVYCNGATWTAFEGKPPPSFSNAGARAQCNGAQVFSFQTNVFMTPQASADNDTVHRLKSCAYHADKWASDFGLSGGYCVFSDGLTFPPDGMIGCSVHFSTSFSGSGIASNRIIIVNE